MPRRPYPWERNPRATSFRPSSRSQPRHIFLSTFWHMHWNVQSPEGVHCENQRRIGPLGDGGKMLCLDAQVRPSDPCSIVTVGVGGDPGKPPDFRFEVDFHRHFPRCSITTYDGTNFGRGAIRNAPSFLRFRAVNFGVYSWRAHHADPVRVLKMDCEGCEFSSLERFVHHLCPEQVLVEVHGCMQVRKGYTVIDRPRSRASINSMMRTMNRTHGLFGKERNPHNRGGPCDCYEFAWQRRSDAACLSSRMDAAAAALNDTAALEALDAAYDASRIQRYLEYRRRVRSELQQRTG